jgi:D-3-phosphoglycerate dehydrogenase
LRGLTVGIVGLGGNGRRIAEVLASFQTRIIATDLFPVDKPNHVESLWPADELPKLLNQSDVVILCVPLNGHTLGMINEKTLAQFKSGSILVNVARGPVVVERDLVAALESNQLSAAALDVTEIEPLPASSPLWDMPNVIITPHVGAQSARRVDDSTAFFCDNLKRFEQGLPPVNLVEKQLGFPLPEHRQDNDS